MTRPRAALCVAAALATLAALVTITGHAASLNVAANKLTTASDTVPAPAGEQTCTLEAAPDPSKVARDTYREQHTTTSHGSATELVVRSQRTTGQNAQSQNSRALVWFDVASCGIPSGATVVGAELTMRRTASNFPGESIRSHAVHRLSETWSEDAAPSFTIAHISAASDSETVSNSSTAVTWTVTTDVAAFLSGTANHGWLVKDTAEATSSPQQNAEFKYTSRENATEANRPVLVITYTVP